MRESGRAKIAHGIATSGKRAEIKGSLKRLAVKSDTVVVDGADRLRDGADVDIPAPGQQKIQAPSGAAADAARTAQRAAAQKAMTEACSADVKKLCGSDAPGSREARTCLVQNRDSLSSTCSAAMAKLRGGGRGGRGGRGGP